MDIKQEDMTQSCQNTEGKFKKNLNDIQKRRQNTQDKKVLVEKYNEILRTEMKTTKKMN